MPSKNVRARCRVGILNCLFETLISDMLQTFFFCFWLLRLRLSWVGISVAIFIYHSVHATELRDSRKKMLIYDPVSLLAYFAVLELKWGRKLISFSLSVFERPPSNINAHGKMRNGNVLRPVSSFICATSRHNQKHCWVMFDVFPNGMKIC